ncbi:MAG: HipA domain-containing protein [Bacteroides sp.]
MTTRCLYCYEPLGEGEADYHPRCSRKLFGTPKPPLLPYTSKEVRSLADEVIRSQTTLTGVQPKLSLDIDQMSLSPRRFTIVGLWGRFILKPQTELYPHLPELEDLTMHLAELAKIETVPHGLIRFSDGELAYITRRIDRTPKGEKLPMEDMCQLAERLTEYKYRGSHELIAKLILQYSSVPKLDLVKYWEQVFFAWLVGNADMHLKNYSLYAPDSDAYQLTPAYDLLATALVLPSDTEELALTLCGKKRKLSRAHFLEAMTASGLDPKVCEKLFARFQKVLPAWEGCIRQSFLPEDMQEAYVEGIETRALKIFTL